MPQFEFSRLKSVIANPTNTVISAGTQVERDDVAEESNFLPFNHASITPVIFVVAGCNLATTGTITTNLANGFANVRVGDAISLTVAGTGPGAMVDTTVASVVSLTQITVAGTITAASTGNSSTVTITPRVANCILTANSTTITTNTVNGFDRIQPGDSVTWFSGTGSIPANTTVLSVPNTTTIVVSAAPGAGTATLSFSAVIGGCTVPAGVNPVVTTTVPFGFSRVRPGDTVAFATGLSGGAVLGTATVVTSVNSATSITLGSAINAAGAVTNGTSTTATTTGQTSSLVFTPVAIAPTAWAIRLLYQRNGSVVTIRPTVYLYDGSLGIVTGTATNATAAISLTDSQNNVPTVDLDTFYNAIRVTRSV